MIFHFKILYADSQHCQTYEPIHIMAPPQLSEDEVDDLIYFSRAGEEQDLSETLSALVSKATGGDTALAILASARDEGKNTCLHMAAGNGHEGSSQQRYTRFKKKEAQER